MLDPYSDDILWRPLDDKIHWINDSFSYLPSINRFVDRLGCIIHDLSRMFYTWELNEWKKTKDYGLIQGKDGQLYDFYYLDEEAEDDIIILIGHNESFGIQMDRVYY